MFHSMVSLQPKDSNGPLRVVIIGRISTEHQDLQNIAASFRFAEDYLARVYDGPVEIERLGERASGMLVDRETIRRAEELIATGRIDVILAEDLSRIFRNPARQYSFVQNAVDHECRLIAIADNIDTGTDHWEIMLGAAAFRHGTFIPDVRRRVRRTATHSFHNGGMVLKIRYGYRKLSRDEAATGQFGPQGLRIARTPECTATIRQICRWVHEGVSYVRIAERLNTAGIVPGPYSIHKRWTSANVVNLLRDPILSGTRRFRVVVHDPVYATGKHRRRRGTQPEVETCPELAHMTIEDQQGLWKVMDERAQAWGAPEGTSSQRQNVPRCRALWPGQSATCAICGGRMYDMGKFLKCANALPGAIERCWNHVQASIAIIRHRIMDWLISTTAGIPDARNALVESVLVELERSQQGGQSELVQFDGRIAAAETASRNLAKAIAHGGRIDALLKELEETQLQLGRLRAEREEAVAARGRKDPFPTRDELAQNLQDHMIVLLQTSYDFSDVFRRAVTEFRIAPVQALDTPLVRPRGLLTFQFDRLRQDVSRNSAPLTLTATLNLFEPPAHIRWSSACAALKGKEPDLSLKQIAARLGVGHMTVKRGLHYARLMGSVGLTEPYRELVQRPKIVSRWHPRHSGRGEPTPNDNGRSRYRQDPAPNPARLAAERHV